VEASKAVLGSAARGALSPEQEARRANTLAVMDFVLSHMLRLFHPFLPFITEELWQGMGFNQDLPAAQGGDTIMFAHWPKPLDDDFKAHYGLDESDERVVDAKYELVGRGRNLRREYNLPVNQKVGFVFKPAAEVSAHDAAVIRILLNAATLDIDAGYVPTRGTPSALTDLGELFMPLEGLIDVAAERARLQKEIGKVAADIAKVEAKLGNPGFVAKAPPAVLEEARRQLAESGARRQQLQASLDALGAA
jgi:valyl-tRNA synthetase